METVIYKVDKLVARVSFNRPEVHNAFNDLMIQELTDLFTQIKEQRDLRVVVLTGEGKSFSAGADINWMREVKDYSFEESFQNSLKLADLFYLIYTLPKPTIARVNGAAIGGGTGLVAVCDLAIASAAAKFSFSEVKLGLVPAAISPYVIKKCGEGRAREFFLTGERLSPEKALLAGLVNQVVPPGDLDGAVDDLVNQLLSSGPQAIGICKDLLREVPKLSLEEARGYTARVLAGLRVSAEGQEGTMAFLEKRKPNWSAE